MAVIGIACEALRIVPGVSLVICYCSEMQQRISLDQFVEFIRDLMRISNKRSIGPDTRIEADLGVTGDDGVDLLAGIERRFNIDFPAGDRFRRLFGLTPNEFLFHSEGLGFRSEKVKDLTVGQLYEAVCQVGSNQNQV